ncbi:MAG: glycosyltransferase family 4 protein [Candidatus Hodarchaeota archaeon]
MRIGIDATDISAEMFKGGIYHYIVNLFSTLREIDKENQYILFFNYFLKRHSTACRDAMQLLEGKNMQVRLSRFPRTLRKNLRIPANIFIGNIDIFHGPFDNVLPVAGCKKITTIHDLRYFDIYPRLHKVLPELADYNVDSHSYKGWDRWMKAMGKRVYSAVQRADHVITVSEHTCDSLMNLLNVKRKKIHIIHNGVSRLFMPVKDRQKIRRITEKYCIDHNYLIFVGHMDPFKNILRMIDAYHMIRNDHGVSTPRLVIITPMPKSFWFYTIVHHKIEELNLIDDIHIIRDVSDEEMPYFYNGATALLLPSLYEGFGLPALEAMACGTPVIASKVCSIPEVVGDSALLVDPHSTSSIAEAISRILSDDNLRKNLAMRGLRRSKLFSWEKTARQTLKVYEHATEG